MLEAKDLAVEAAREAKASIVNSPAAGTELTRPERRMRAEGFVRSPEQMELQWQMLEGKFNPPNPGMVPRRWFDYGVAIMKDRKQEADDATS